MSPETDQRCLDAHGQVWSCGVEAAAELKVYAEGGRTWNCELTGIDRYSRFLGTCSIDGEDVGRWLVDIDGPWLSGILDGVRSGRGLCARAPIWALKWAPLPSPMGLAAPRT